MQIEEGIYRLIGIIGHSGRFRIACKGDSRVIIGGSGSGKSVILNNIVGPESGGVFMEDAVLIDYSLNNLSSYTK